MWTFRGGGPGQRRRKLCIQALLVGRLFNPTHWWHWLWAVCAESSVCMLLIPPVMCGLSPALCQPHVNNSQAVPTIVCGVAEWQALWRDMSGVCCLTFLVLFAFWLPGMWCAMTQRRQNRQVSSLCVIVACIQMNPNPGCTTILKWYWEASRLGRQ